MDFDFTVPGLTAQQVTVWDAAALKRLGKDDLDNFKKIVDAFGKRSAKAQGLGASITDIYRLRATDQRLYLAATRHNGNTVLLGGLKTGSKKLFVRTVAGALQEVEPQCVLDFYVHEDYQRKGVGKQLFEFFLAHEQQSPAGIAYDRPSNKLLAFLSRHYGLQDFQPQNNNFVLFDEFWKVHPDGGPKGGGSRGIRGGGGGVKTMAQAVVPAPPPMPPWVAGLPASSRPPQMNPSTAVLMPSSTNGSPSTTLTAPMEPRVFHPSPLQIDSTSSYIYNTAATQAPHAQSHPWGAPDISSPSGSSMAVPHQSYSQQEPPHQSYSQQEPPLQSPADRQPSFGRRGPPALLTAEPYASAYTSLAAGGTGMGMGMGGMQPPTHLPHARGDALDEFYRSGGAVQDQQPMSPLGGAGAGTPGRWGGAGGGMGSGPWPVANGSVQTPQGPAYLYSAVPAPNAGTGLGYGGVGGGGGGGYGEAGYTQYQQQHHQHQQYQEQPAVLAPPLAGTRYGMNGVAGGGMGRHGGGGMGGGVNGGSGSQGGLGGPRYTIPPWGQEDDGTGGGGRMVQHGMLSARGGQSASQWTPSPQQQQQSQQQQQLYHQQKQHQQYNGGPMMGGGPHTPAGALVPSHGGVGASPAQLLGNSFGKGGGSAGGAGAKVMTAREAALAARAGSGAAGCLVW